MNQELLNDAEKIQALADQLIEMEAESLIQDRNFVIELVYQYVQDRFNKMDPSEILEEASYAGLIDNGEDK